MSTTLMDLSDDDLRAYRELHKNARRLPQNAKRRADVEQHGIDTKFTYHVVRLLDEVEQILIEGDVDLQRNREQLKAIRRGDWTADQVREYFARKEKELETAYLNSSLPHGPDEAKIKRLLLDCLEEHFGDLSHAVAQPDKERDLLRQIKALCEQAGV